MDVGKLLRVYPQLELEIPKFVPSSTLSFIDFQSNLQKCTSLPPLKLLCSLGSWSLAFSPLSCLSPMEPYSMQNFILPVTSAHHVSTCLESSSPLPPHLATPGHPIFCWTFDQLGLLTTGSDGTYFIIIACTVAFLLNWTVCPVTAGMDLCPSSSLLYFQGLEYCRCQWVFVEWWIDGNTPYPWSSSFFYSVPLVPGWEGMHYPCQASPCTGVWF